MSDYWDGEAWVCVDCYFAHHYGTRQLADDVWTVGPDFGRENEVHVEPLALLAGCKLADNTCSNHEFDRWDEDCEPCPHCGREDEESGIHGFSSSSCQGCGSTLGGSRYRLAYKVNVSSVKHDDGSSPDEPTE